MVPIVIWAVMDRARGTGSCLPKRLDGFALEGGLLGVGEGVFRFEGGDGGGGKGLGAGLALGGLIAECLELLRLAAEAADFDGTWFRDEIAHREILSYAEGWGADAGDGAALRQAAGLEGSGGWIVTRREWCG